MKITSKLLIATALLSLCVGGANVYAQTDSEQGIRPPEGHGPRGSGMMRGSGTVGSTTGQRPEGMRGPGSTDSTARGGERHSSSSEEMRGPMMRGIPGVVVAVESGRFTMKSRGLGQATTTLTVVVSDTTKYFSGSSTATFSDITAGSKVVVLGKVATSTRTVTALRIQIGNSMGEGMKERTQKSEVQNEEVQQGGGHPDFLTKFKKLFRRGGQPGEGQTSGATTGGPAAAGASGDFINEVLSSLFGWMHQ